jgi:hypothetical protein
VCLWRESASLLFACLVVVTALELVLGAALTNGPPTRSSDVGSVAVIGLVYWRMWCGRSWARALAIGSVTLIGLVVAIGASRAWDGTTVLLVAASVLELALLVSPAIREHVGEPTLGWQRPLGIIAAGTLVVSGAATGVRGSLAPRVPWPAAAQMRVADEFVADLYQGRCVAASRLTTSGRVVGGRLRQGVPMCGFAIGMPSKAQYRSDCDWRPSTLAPGVIPHPGALADAILRCRGPKVGGVSDGLDVYLGAAPRSAAPRILQVA